MSEGTRQRRGAGLRQVAREAALRTKRGRHYLLAHYPFMFDPPQLITICELAVEGIRASNAQGVAEVGVAQGNTTLFLINHLLHNAILPNYHCIDTFSGFTDADVAVENARGKREGYREMFKVNSAHVFSLTMHEAGYGDIVSVHAADAATFEYGSLPELGFALVDVDLHRPMSGALRGAWERLRPGGYLVADDCADGEHVWDGARQAFDEFCEELGVDGEIRDRKLGVIRKV